MRLTIKGMVCRHCIDAVEKALREASLHPEHVSLGTADIAENLTDGELEKIDAVLHAIGFGLIHSSEHHTVELVKQAVIRHVREGRECKLNLSACIEKELGQPYDTVSRIFSSIEGRTIEKYQIAQRVEWVKELLLYGNSTISDIAFDTGYSSAAHLTRQFKSVTGMTPTAFLAVRPDRIPINEI